MTLNVNTQNSLIGLTITTGQVAHVAESLTPPSITGDRGIPQANASQSQENSQAGLSWDNPDVAAAMKAMANISFVKAPFGGDNDGVIITTSGTNPVV